MAVSRFAEPPVFKVVGTAATHSCRTAASAGLAEAAANSTTRTASRRVGRP